MEARILRVAVVLAAFFSLGAGYRTANFVVEAPTKELAEKIGSAAEQYRRELAIEWLGKPMPNWYRPCPIVAEVGPGMGAGGSTSFVFDRGEVFGWDMHIQGSEERVLDSVLPHEITHTIFASHFRRPLPRWADEGACTTVEHASERTKQQRLLIRFLRTQKGIPFDKMFAMKDYPPDVLPLYAQGYSLARFLIDQGGKRRFLEFVGEGMKDENWSATIKRFYGFDGLANLQDEWLAWVKQGSPPMNQSNELLASHEKRGPIYRAQSDDRLADNSASAEDAGWSPVGSGGPFDAPEEARVASREQTASPRRSGRPSVYDRRGDVPERKSAAPPDRATESIRSPASAEMMRLAQRDAAGPAEADRKVLLEWRRPEPAQR